MEEHSDETHRHVNDAMSTVKDDELSGEQCKIEVEKPFEEPLTQKSLSEIREAFKIFDKDGNGYITASELRQFLSSLGYNMTEAELMDMMNKIDADGNGAIDFPEFQELTTKKLHVLSEEELARQTFNVFDRTQKGYISINDLKHIFMTLEQTFSDMEIQDMLMQADSDQDGAVTFEDFLKMMNTSSGS